MSACNKRGDRFIFCTLSVRFWPTSAYRNRQITLSPARYAQADLVKDDIEAFAALWTLQSLTPITC